MKLKSLQKYVDWMIEHGIVVLRTKDIEIVFEPQPEPEPMDEIDEIVGALNVRAARGEN